ncbi:MAG: Ig-like domain-containing protein, partial [Ruminococcus sp.]|nr:Ig-like domain-containing protein [Ruminococcus sp.]
MKKIVSILLSVCLLAGIFTSMPTSYFAAKKKAQRVSLKKKSVTIKIIESEKNIAYGKTSVKIKKAKGVTIKKITYKSTNKKIAKVNKKGVVTAVKKGTAKIKAIVKY